MQTRAARFIQVHCVRASGMSEFITINLLAKKLNFPIVPHVGDMGQLYQHLVLFTYITIHHDIIFLEHVPHISHHFLYTGQVKNGFYMTPQELGSSVDIIDSMQITFFVISELVSFFT